MKKIVLFLLAFNCLLLIDNASISAQGPQWKVLNTGNSWLPYNYVMKTAWDTSGNLWLATWGKGLYKYDGKTLTNFNKTNNQIPNDSVYTIYFDHNNVKWIGTHKGLANYNNTTWNIFTKSNASLPDDDIKAITEDSIYNMYFGTEKGGLMTFDRANWTFYNKSAPQNNTYIPDNSVHGIAVDNYFYNEVWVATNKGLGVLSDTTWSTYTGISYFPNDTLNAIYMDVNLNKWIATTGGLVSFNGSLSNSGTWTTYNKSNVPAFPANNVTALTVDDNDNVWFGTYDKSNGNTALGFYDGNAFSFYESLTTLLPNKMITDISFDHYGNTWVSTFGGGITIFNIDGITSLLSVNNLKNPENNAVVYPNPCQDALNIKFSHAPVKAALITLTDITGHIIQSTSQNSKLITLNTAGLAKGIYLLNILMDNKVINKKIVKE